MYCHSQPANYSLSLHVLPKLWAAGVQHLLHRDTAMPVPTARKVHASNQKNHCLSECSCDGHADENWAWKYFRRKTTKEIHYSLHTTPQQLYTTTEYNLTRFYYFSLTPLPPWFLCWYLESPEERVTFSLPTPELYFLLNWRYLGCISPLLKSVSAHDQRA